MAVKLNENREIVEKIKEYYNKHTKWYMRLQNICADIVHKML